MGDFPGSPVVKTLCSQCGGWRGVKELKFRMPQSTGKIITIIFLEKSNTEFRLNRRQVTIPLQGAVTILNRVLAPEPTTLLRTWNKRKERAWMCLPRIPERPWGEHSSWNT